MALEFPPCERALQGPFRFPKSNPATAHARPALPSRPLLSRVPPTIHLPASAAAESRVSIANPGKCQGIPPLSRSAVSFFTRSHTTSNSDTLQSCIRRPSRTISSFNNSKRRANRAVASISSALGSASKNRAKLTAAKSKSPSSRFACSRSPPCRARSISHSSSRTFSNTPPISGQSNPSAEAEL